MENYLLGGIIIIGFIVVYVLLSRRFNQMKPSDTPDQSLQMLNQNVQGMQQRLDKVSEGLNSRLDNAAKVIGEVNKELGQVQEMSRSMRDLQNFLKSPKLRGNIGEQVLQDMLSQNFPQSFFDMQYKFPNGEVVDAVLKTDNGMIGIDSKFPLENFDKLLDAELEADRIQFQRLFLRDVKKHIKDISNKYILPEEGTVNFAVMYVPSEAVFYEIIRQERALNDYAVDAKVLMVSPNSFFYFLRVIMMGMQGKRIEEQAQRILTTMEAITKDTKKFGDTLGVLNTHLSNASGALDRVNTDYSRLSAKVEQIKLLKD